MKIKSYKYDFTQLAGVSLQLRGGLRAGFTLVEILVAVTIIVMIISMVYGSYFATAKSTDVYKAKMTMSSRTRKVLGQMARQIRCSYVGKTEEHTDSAETISRGKSEISEGPIIYFNCEQDAPGGEILHLVTTNGLFRRKGQVNGLFDVAYKFDKSSGTLSLSQRRFVGTPERLIEERNWRPLLINVECVELDFFDGQQWLSKWDFEQKKKLPFAVKIGITSRDENYRQCCYVTIAYVGCSWNQGRGTQPARLVLVNE